MFSFQQTQNFTEMLKFSSEIAVFLVQSVRLATPIEDCCIVKNPLLFLKKVPLTSVYSAVVALHVFFD